MRHSECEALDSKVRHVDEIAIHELASYSSSRSRIVQGGSSVNDLANVYNSAVSVLHLRDICCSLEAHKFRNRVTFFLSESAHAITANTELISVVLRLSTFWFQRWTPIESGNFEICWKNQSTSRTQKWKEKCVSEMASTKTLTAFGTPTWA